MPRLFICLFVLYQYILNDLILIAGRSLSILLFLCLNLTYKVYQKGDEHIKNVYYSRYQTNSSLCKK